MSRSILISGGSGSFGQAMVKQLLEAPPPEADWDVPGPFPVWEMGGWYDRIIIYSRDEWKQWDMRQRIPDPDLRLRFFLGDVRDLPRLTMAMRGVTDVVHAAALKQVPAGDYNPTEFIKTNVFGAMNVTEAAIAQGVERVLALSSDKATAPLNLYGATKLTAEKLFVAANAMSGARTRFACCRYGNVTGTRGSVVPLWKEVAKAGGPIPITDPAMTRFWMTLDEAVDFVVRCIAAMNGCEVFIPTLESYRVVDLAEAVAPGVPLVTIGVRPGEKLHESLISRHEARSAWVLPGGGHVLLPEPTEDLAVQVPKGAARMTPTLPDWHYSSEEGEKLSSEELRRRLEEIETHG